MHDRHTLSKITAKFKICTTEPIFVLSHNLNGGIGGHYEENQ